MIFGHFWEPLKIRAGAQNGPKKSIRRPVSVQKRPKDAQKPFPGEFEKHKALVNDAVTTAENLHGRYLGALRNNEYEVAQSISQAILLNKETESRAFENALLEFKEKSLVNYANFNNLP